MSPELMLTAALCELPWVVHDVVRNTRDLVDHMGGDETQIRTPAGRAAAQKIDFLFEVDDEETLGQLRDSGDKIAAVALDNYYAVRDKYEDRFGPISDEEDLLE